MSMLDIELVNEPLDVDCFTYLNDDDYPLCVLGFQLKNLYDQKRLIINEKYNPKDFIHLVPNDAIAPKFLRGITLTLKKDFLPLITHLEALGTHDASAVSVESYKKILKQYNLTCENCYAYLNKGMYPIDSECLDTIASTNLTQDSLYCDVLEHNDFTFQTFGYFVIYILSNKNISKTQTKSYLHAVVKEYNSVQ